MVATNSCVICASPAFAVLAKLLAAIAGVLQHIDGVLQRVSAILNGDHGRIESAEAISVQGVSTAVRQTAGAFLFSAAHREVDSGELVQVVRRLQTYGTKEGRKWRWQGDEGHEAGSVDDDNKHGACRRHHRHTGRSWLWFCTCSAQCLSAAAVQRSSDAAFGSAWPCAAATCNVHFLSQRMYVRMGVGTLRVLRKEGWASRATVLKTGTRNA